MKKCLFVFLGLCLQFQVEALTPNQTQEISPIYSGATLPFQVSVELADFSLPGGIHSGISGIWNGKWVLLAGRTNGLHGFNNTGDFPPPFQNTLVYVVNPETGQVWTKDLRDPSSGLTTAQIDLLSVTSPQYFQRDQTLYMTGGYGVDTATGDFSTKAFLTAIDLPVLMEWVTKSSKPAVAAIRFLEHPIFQITGGRMYRGDGNLILLMFGQNFVGQYTPSSNGNYSKQVRRFYIRDDGKNLSVKVKKSLPQLPDPDYRRRDLNIVPIVRDLIGESVPSFVALSGVFTIDGGIWTVPVIIDTKGKAEMADPLLPSTFKQAMNNYVSPTLSMYSGHFGSTYVLLFGGLSFGYFNASGFQTDTEIPFINQITTVEYNQKAEFTQYLMAAEYPVIPSNFSNPGNPLLFGAGGVFLPAGDPPHYDNNVIKFDHLEKGTTHIGYIVGGIMSTLPNTNTMADSAASPYIFRVLLQK
jgi:hypothetical protein